MTDIVDQAEATQANGSSIERFHDQLSASVRQSVGNVSGFDIGVLLPILLDVLVDMLGKCGNARETIRKGGFAAQYAARKAVRIARDRASFCDMNSRDQAKVADCLVEQCERCDDEELDRILNEADDVRIDYELF